MYMLYKTREKTTGKSKIRLRKIIISESFSPSVRAEKNFAHMMSGTLTLTQILMQIS